VKSLRSVTRCQRASERFSRHPHGPLNTPTTRTRRRPAGLRLVPKLFLGGDRSDRAFGSITFERALRFRSLADSLGSNLIYNRDATLYGRLPSVEDARSLSSSSGDRNIIPDISSTETM
jgi:hypothetical protein